MIDERELATRAVHVGAMRRRHLRSVVRIEQDASPRPWNLGVFMSELRLRESRRYVVARIDGRVVGFGGIMLTGEDAHVTNIAVDADHRRRSVATRILLVLARAAIDEGADRLSLEVRARNHAAQSLYRRFGFAPAGVRKNYYASTSEDALVMWADEIDTVPFARRLATLEAELPTPTIEDGVR